MDNKDNQKRDIALEFLNSMEIIAQAQIDKTKRFDQTIVCTIVDDSDADKGKYKVSNGSATFIAYGNDQYTKDTSVMVTIPLGDYDQQKMIIGRYTTDENEIYNYVKPFAHLLDVTGNINFKNDSGRSSVGFYANGAALAGYNYKDDNERRVLGGPKHAGFWSALQEDEGRYYNPLLGYETFGLKADFTSFLREYNCIQGKYGLRAYVFSYNPEEEGLAELREVYNETPANLTTVFDRLTVLNTMSQDHKIQCSIFDFDTDEMNGDVYDFDIGYEQEAIFDISKLGSILHIEILFYQNDNFAYKTDIPDDPTTPDEREDLHFIDYRDEELGILMLPGENLKVSNVYFCVGYNKEYFTGDKLILYTEDDLTYSDANGSTMAQNKKIVKAKWIHLNQVGNIEIYDAGHNYQDFRTANYKVDGKWYKIEWYRYYLNQKSEHTYSGIHWKEQNINAGTTYLDNFIFEFEPNFESQNEQIQAHLIPYNVDVNNHKIADEKAILSSNVIVFTNEKQVLGSGLRDVFSQDDFYLVNPNTHDTFNYFLYGNDNKIIKVIGASKQFNELGQLEAVDTIQSPDEKIRRIDCYFKNTDLTLGNNANSFNITYIKWKFPSTNTMIIPCDVEGNPVSTQSEIGVNDVIDNHARIADANLYQYYKIADYYHNTWTNNIVECEIIIDRVKYKAAVTMHFGPQSSNGSDYTLVPHFIKDYYIGPANNDDNKKEKIPNALPICEQGSQVTVALDIYDQNGNYLPWNNETLLGEHVTVNWEPFYHTTYDIADTFIAFTPVLGQNIPDNRIREVEENGIKVKKIFNSDYKYYDLKASRFQECDTPDDTKKYYIKTYYKINVTEKEYIGNTFYIKRPLYFAKDNSVEYDKTIRYYTIAVYNGTGHAYQLSNNQEYYEYVANPDSEHLNNYFAFIEATSHDNDTQYYLPRNKDVDYILDGNKYNPKEEYFIIGYKYSDKYINNNTYTLNIGNYNISNDLISYNPFKIYYTQTVKRFNRGKQAITPQVDEEDKWKCHITFEKPQNISLNECMQELLVLKIVVKNFVPYDLEAYFPIPLNLEDNIAAYAGPEFIRYDSAGYVDSYRDPIITEFKGNIHIGDIKPKLFIPQQKFLENNDTWTSYTDGRNYGQINENKNIYNPPSVYLQEEDPLCCGIQIQEYNEQDNDTFNPILSQEFIPVDFNNSDEFNNYIDKQNLYALINYESIQIPLECFELKNNNDSYSLKVAYTNSSGIGFNTQHFYIDTIHDNKLQYKTYYFTSAGTTFDFFNPKYCYVDYNDSKEYYIYFRQIGRHGNPQFSTPIYNDYKFNLLTKQVIKLDTNTIINDFVFRPLQYDYYIHAFSLAKVLNDNNQINIDFFDPRLDYTRSRSNYSHLFFTINTQDISSLPDTYWTQPLVFYQNEYPNGTVNKWDGETFEINEQAGTILSHAIVAGKKNDDNTFSGVMLGALEYFDNVERSLTEQTGIYGFHHGAQSYAFKEDGTAFIGKAGHGRIHFDGNRGTIQSETWTEQQQAGMQIDLDDGIIDMRRPANEHTTVSRELGTLTEGEFYAYRNNSKYELTQDNYIEVNNPDVNNIRDYYEYVGPDRSDPYHINRTPSGSNTEPEISTPNHGNISDYKWMDKNNFPASSIDANIGKDGRITCLDGNIYKLLQVSLSTSTNANLGKIFISNLNNLNLDDLIIGVTKRDIQINPSYTYNDNDINYYKIINLPGDNREIRFEKNNARNIYTVKYYNNNEIDGDPQYYYGFISFSVIDLMNNGTIIPLSTPKQVNHQIGYWYNDDEDYENVNWYKNTIGVQYIGINVEDIPLEPIETNSAGPYRLFIKQNASTILPNTYNTQNFPDIKNFCDGKLLYKLDLTQATKYTVISFIEGTKHYFTKENHPWYDENQPDICPIDENVTEYVRNTKNDNDDTNDEYEIYENDDIITPIPKWNTLENCIVLGVTQKIYDEENYTFTNTSAQQSFKQFFTAEDYYAAFCGDSIIRRSHEDVTVYYPNRNEYDNFNYYGLIIYSPADNEQWLTISNDNSDDNWYSSRNSEYRLRYQYFYKITDTNLISNNNRFVFISRLLEDSQTILEDYYYNNLLYSLNLSAVGVYPIPNEYPYSSNWNPSSYILYNQTNMSEWTETEPINSNTYIKALPELNSTNIVIGLSDYSWTTAKEIFNIDSGTRLMRSPAGFTIFNRDDFSSLKIDSRVIDDTTYYYYTIDNRKYYGFLIIDINNCKDLLTQNITSIDLRRDPTTANRTNYAQYFYLDTSPTDSPNDDFIPININGDDSSSDNEEEIILPHFQPTTDNAIDNTKKYYQLSGRSLAEGCDWIDGINYYIAPKANNEDPGYITIDSSLNNEIPFSIGTTPTKIMRDFYVTWDGLMYANNGTFNGTINASSGAIGNWIIEEGALTDSQNKIKLSTIEGIYAELGTIGGWAIDSTTLSNGNTILDSNKGIILDNTYLTVKLSNNQEATIGYDILTSVHGDDGRNAIGFTYDGSGLGQLLLNSDVISLYLRNGPQMYMDKNPAQLVIREINKLYINGWDLISRLKNIEDQIAALRAAQSSSNNSSGSGSS